MDAPNDRSAPMKADDFLFTRRGGGVEEWRSGLQRGGFVSVFAPVTA